MEEWKDLGLSSGFFIRQGPPVSLLEAFAFRLLFHTKDPVDEEGEETFFFSFQPSLLFFSFPST